MCVECVRTIDLYSVKEMAEDYVHSASHYVVLAREANVNVSTAIDKLRNVAPALKAVEDNAECVQGSVVQCTGIQMAIESRLSGQQQRLSDAEVIVKEANETYNNAVHICKCLTLCYTHLTYYVQNLL